jgi:hypothetical protein
VEVAVALADVVGEQVDQVVEHWEPVMSPLRIRRTRPFHPRFLLKMSAYRV